MRRFSARAQRRDLDGYAVLIQRHGIGRAVLLDQFFVGNKRQGIHLNFHIIIVPLINAQPEHQHRFSPGADLGLANAKDRVFIFLLKQGVQLFSYRSVQ